LGDGFGQHASQTARGRMQPVVLQCVDRRLHPPLVKPVGHGSREGWRRKPANAAKRGAGWIEFADRAVKRVAAADAGGPGLEGELKPAAGTDWNRAKLRQGRAPKGAGGGKEGTTQGIHGTSKHAGDCAPTGSSRWGNVERQ
jgi:hypothetical protein